MPYTLVVKNVAGVPLTNVQVMDNLLRTFNPGGTAGITIAVSGLTVGGAHDAPAGADPTCTAAAGFNGALQSALLGGSDSLLPGQKCVISFVATVSWGANPVPSAQLLNQAFAAAGASAQTPGGGILSGGAEQSRAAADLPGEHARERRLDQRRGHPGHGARHPAAAHELLPPSIRTRRPRPRRWRSNRPTSMWSSR